MLHFDDRDIVGGNYILDIRHRESDILGLSLALCFVCWVHLVAERMPPFGVEAHCDMRRRLLAQYLLQSVAKAEYRRSVEALRRNARRTYQRVISPVDQRVGVEQEQFLLHGAHHLVTKTTMRAMARKRNNPPETSMPITDMPKARLRPKKLIRNAPTATASMM